MRLGKKLIGGVLGLGLLATPAFTFANDRHEDRHDDRGGRPAIHEDVHGREFRGDRDRDRDHFTLDRPRVEVFVPHVGLYAPDCR